MINIQIEGWSEKDLESMIAHRCVEKIISSKFKTCGDTQDKYGYTPRDKFKNYIANLVANKIYQYMISDEEIKKRIDNSIHNAQQTIVKQYIKGESK